MDTNITFNDMVLNTIQEKRDFLKKLSTTVAPLLEAGEYKTTNEAVINTFYIDKVHTNFKTFNEWKREGYSIKKGSKAFIVWGKPKSAQDAEKATEQGKDEPTTDDDTRDFYPIAFLFSNAQVEKKGAQNA
jgi:hypothetical protein